VYQQVYDPVGNSLGLSTIFAVLPLLSLFVLLGGLKLKAQWAALISLAVAIVVAIAVYSMPVGQTLDAGVEGAVFGLFPIMWIVVNAIWIYNMTVDSGHFAVLRRSFASVSDDQRIQAILIAFCFGALMEALAGFGTPVAISAVMLIAMGFKPVKAATLALVANTAPVAFGAIAVPITTLSEVSSLPKDDLGAMVGRQTPLLALIVPLILVGMVDGRRGVRQTWPAAVTGGVAFAIGQFACSNYLSVELTDIVASLLSAGAIVALVRVWRPGEVLTAQTITIGQWLAGAGAAFAFLSPLLGWFGVAVTGSDTSSNALFGALQVSAANKADLSATLMASGNSSGGVLGKTISPQNLAIGAAAVGMAGQEGEIFRKVIGWSLVLILVMCVIVLLQSTSVLSWMVV
jgi:lactate permease